MKAGKLEAVLPGFRLTAVPLSLLIVPQKAAIERVRLMIATLVQSARAVPDIT